MKNVLIITYYFPPKPEIGGVRLYGLAKYLHLHGWKPIILTPILPDDPDPAFQIIQTPYDDVIEIWKKRFGLNPKKTLNAQFQIKIDKDRLSIADRFAFLPNEIITYPDAMIGWYDYAVREGERILKTNRIDAILSSSNPVTCHLIAQNLAEKYHVRWVADFRDLWTQNHYFSHSRVRNYFETRLELKTINQASTITTVSQPLADKLAELHKNKPVYSIPNGFDPDIMNSGIPPSDQFRIVYTGVIYKGKQDPDKLFAKIDDLCNKKFINLDDIQIDFYGYHEDWLKDDITKYHLQDIVILHGQVPRDIAIAEQRKAQLLLLLTWNDPAEKGIYTGKLFDYLAARRPILSMGNTDGGVVKELLNQTQAGVHVSNEEELKEHLMKAYREYKEYGAVQYRGIDTEVMKYSHKEMGRKFAEVLDGLA